MSEHEYVPSDYTSTRIEQLEKQNKEMGEMLKTIQIGQNNHCPICYGYLMHYKDCKLAKLLKEVEG